MFRIAKNLVKTFEDTLSSSSDSNELNAFFQSIPPNFLVNQIYPQNDSTSSLNPNETVSGLRIVWVDETQLQFQSFFDYIVGINDDPLPLMQNQHGFLYPDYNQMYNILNTIITNTPNNTSAMIKFNVWSAKGGTFRDEYVTLLPRDESQLDDISLTNNGSSPANGNYSIPAFQSLGIKVQWTPLLASTFTYHILQLNIPQGPAQVGGLIPDEDYIIGCQDGLLATGGETLLQDIVRSRANQELILYVYNKVSDCVRPITVSIGANGRLGCNVGYGLLHRIPTVRTGKPSMVSQKQQQHIQPFSESLSSGSYGSADLSNGLPTSAPEGSFVPQEAAGAPVTLPISTGGASLPPPTMRKKKPVHPNMNAMNMSDYFNEGKDEAASVGSSALVSPTPPPIIHKSNKPETPETPDTPDTNEGDINDEKENEESVEQQQEEEQGQEQKES
ncbi:Grh1p NDAI_0F04470 [Naumovozyma dairenensis CBS 421]|uniref:PDZ GRASP-type domain-containing protein n=1 Tax=Naumovozyma dairenensis (strain ATCC 10597 / BCRC 20456 / CBS 421 / NBRC 0211 / NRRL Y-12639) TaxID=1071378 RepID=G0WDA4_NAUDC|nr:hypothetical protein NDAI_0F04470 [Naumovozyma dairenensis CBS 421]CCD25765.1 hypothetical protein NDAI_0F04470 [Naumovozyma dairenensis CBS 421]